ncbi:trypsin-like serine protease [Gordonia sp. NPDC003425]
MGTLKKTAVMVAILGAVVATLLAPAATARAAVLPVRSGMEIEVPQTLVTAAECTLGAVVSATDALTAGHCGNVGQDVYTGGGKRIGTIRANRINQGLDIAIIRLAPGTRAVVDPIDWSSGFRKGQTVTKFGVTSGFGRGVITDPRPEVRSARGFSLAPPFLILHDTVSVESSLVSRSGDSGAGVRDASGRVIGILSAGSDTATLIAPVSLIPGHPR